MALGLGSIAFTGFNADGNDDIAFVALETIPAGTVIYFNDQEWQGTGFNTGEGQVTWTASADIAPGAIVTINSFSDAPTSNLGSVSGSSGLGSDGEIVYAYVGEAFAPTVFLAAIANDGFAQSGGTLEGTGLVVGETAIDLSNGGANPGEDVALFTGPRNGQASFDAYAAVINDVANWTTQDGSGDQSGDGTAPDLPFDLGGFTLGGAESQSVGFQGALISQVEGNDGATSFTFTVARSGGSTGMLDFTGTIAAGDTDGSDYADSIVPLTFSGTIAAGETTATVTVTVAGDTTIEADESFTLTLTGATNTEIPATINPGAASATGTIVNDDAAPTGLVAGDIAFVGFNADGNDDIAFAVLKDIAAGTVIYFNDQEWQGTGFNTGEGQVVWTATSDIAAGSIVTINSFSDAPTSNLGSVSGSSGLGSDGEIVYAYVGAPFVPTTFLAAIANDGFAQSGGTLEGTGLVVGETAIDLSNGGANPGEDVAVFTGPRSGGANYADYAAVINDVANWTTQDGSDDQSGDGTAPDLPFDLGGFILGAEPAQTVAFAATAVSIAEGNDGTKVLTFTVARTGGTSGQVDFTGSFEAGTTDAADFGGALPTGFSGSIAAGANSATVTITISGDTMIEDTEAFSLTLTGATNTLGSDVTIAPDGAAATGTILNDDYGLSIGGINVYDPAESLQGSATTPTATDDIVLVRLGSIQGASAGAESTAYLDGKVYATNINGNTINVATVTAQGTLVGEAAIALSDLPDYKAGGVNAVAAKNGVIAVGYEGVTPGQPGHVALFNAADNSLITTVTVGVLPDQLTFTPDGSKLLVANEGEALSAAENPVGGISIIDLSGGAAAAAVVNTIGFGTLDGAEAALADRGLTLFPGAAASADIEPEYITVSPDGTRAYVTLQEVNAVAVIDLTDPTATAPIAIQPLGFIDRSLAGNAFDPSDRDGGINIHNADVLSVLQPDAIASFSVGGATYFITANEGDSRVGVTDSVRLGDSSYVLDPTLFPDAALLKADAELGRLNVLTNVGDTDGDGDFDVIYTLGGRGISIFRQEADGTITKVRETGGEFESIIAQNYPAIFNSNQSTAGSSADTRSDDKGPEPEGVTIGKIGDRTYAFIGLERVGGYMVYDVTDPANAFFVTYKPQTAQDLGPETSVFVSAEDSPTGQALLISGQEISNTVTLYSIQTQSENADAIVGAGDADTFFGRGGDDSISGFGGNDVLTGGLGADRLDGGDGIDTAGYAAATAAVSASLLSGRGLAGEALGDRFVSIENLTGSAFDDSLYGDNGANAILGGAGSDILYGYLGDDRLEGGAGDDLVRGGEGADTLLGGDGADKLLGDEGNDVIAGGAGSDIVYGGIGDDSIDGEADADTLRGDEGNDTLTGGSGDDVLLAGDGNDVLIGGAGRDSMYGGAGADRFMFNAVSESVLAARDILRDFSQADGDLIDLSTIDSGAAGGAFTLVGAFSGTAGELTATALGAFQQVQGDVNGDGIADFTILVAAGGASLTSADFVL